MLTLTIRSTHAADCDVTMQFARDAGNADACPPSEDILCDAISSRRGYALMLNGQVSGLIVALRHYGENLAIEAPWREIVFYGAQPEGFGLFKVMLAVACVSEAVMSPGADAMFMAIPQTVFPQTAACISAGLVPWTPDEPLMRSWVMARTVHATSGQNDPDILLAKAEQSLHFLRLQPDGLTQLAYNLLRWDQPDSLLIRPASRDHGAALPASLLLSVDALLSHRTAVEEVAQADYTYQRLLRDRALLRF